MTSQKTLVTTVTVTMTTTTTPPLLEIDNGNDLQGSPKKTSNTQTSFHRHIVYEPQTLYPKWPLEMRIQEEHGRWLGRSKDEKQDQCDEEKPLRWLSEEKQYNQDNYSKWQTGDHISNDNRIGCHITGSSGNNNMNFVNSGNNNCNYYNTNYIKDCDHLLRDKYVGHDFIAPLSPSPPPPPPPPLPPPPSSSLLMLNQEKMEGEVKDLSDVSSRGLKYPPPRRDSDGHILGSANYSAPSPPERDLTLPYPLTSESHTRNKEKLSPLPSESLKDAHAWKEIFDLDPYMLTNPTLSTTAANAYVWKENVETISEKPPLSSSGGYKNSKEMSESITNERSCRTLSTHATSRPYIVKPKPFYNTSTQTEETELGYDSQLQFKVEENNSIPCSVSSIQSNLELKSDKTSLEKATQVQLPKTSFVDRELVTLEQLRSPNHQEFIPASAPLLRRLTEEYYQMNISEDSNIDITTNTNQPQQSNIDEHVMDENKFNLHIRKIGTNNASQEHQLPFMNKTDLNINKTFTQINEPLQPCVGKIGNMNIDESIISANEQIQTYICINKDNDLNESNANIHEYERNVNECQSKSGSANKNQSVHIEKPQPQFNMDVKIDTIINEQSLSIDEPKLQPMLGIKKSISENSLNILQPQPQSYRDEPTDIHHLNPSVYQPKICKNVKSSLAIKENQLRSFRGEKNNIEPDYMNISEQVTDCKIRKRFDSMDDVFKESKGFPKQIRSDSRLSSQRQEDPQSLLGMTAGVMTELPDPFWLQSTRVNNENLKSRVEFPEKLTQITEGNVVNSELRHISNPENAFRQKEKDNPQTTVNKDASSRSVKDRYRLNHETFLNQTRENVFSQPTEINCRSSESKYGTKFESLLDQTRERKSPILQKKYGSSTDILLNQTARKNQSINSQTSGKRYENVFSQPRESISMQKTISENLENRYGSCEKVGNQSKSSISNLDVHPGLLSNYSPTHFGSVSDILNTPYTTHHEIQAVKPDLVGEKSKVTAEFEKSIKYPNQGLLKTRCPSMDDETFGTFEDTPKTFEYPSLIQHGRSESLPIDSTHENPSQQLRSYYSCTDVNKEKPSEPMSIYGVSDYMDMSGRHQTEWSQINSKTDTTRDSSSFVLTNTKKKRTSSCTSYRIHANFEFEEEPPPQLPPRAYRNMPENCSENSNWIYESLRHRRSYANELRKQARRLNICKPLANITEAHVTDVNEMFGDRTNVDNTNIYAEERDRGKERRKEKQKMPSVNSIKHEAEKTLNDIQDNIENVEISEDIKADLNMTDTDMGNFTNIDEVSVKCQQVDKVNITDIDKDISIINEHSSNNKCSPNINKPASNNNDNLSSNVSQQSLNIDEQYLNIKEQNQLTINKKAIHIDTSINTSEEYKHSTSHIDDIKNNFKTGINSKESDIDIADVSVKTQDVVLQKEHNSFEPNMNIREQESHLMSEHLNINKPNQMYLKEKCNITNTDIDDFTKTDENVNSKECVLHINENSANNNEQKQLFKKEIVQISSLTDLSKARPFQSMQSQSVTSPSQPELFTPSPIFQNSIHKMSSPESSSNKLQFQYRSSSEQCLTSIGSCDDQMKIPLYVSLVNIPTEEQDAGFDSVAGKQHNNVSVKQRIHFFEYDSNGHLVRNRIPPPVPAKPTSLVLRKKFPKEEGFSPTQPSPETEQPPGKSFNFLTDKQPEASIDIMEEKSEQKFNRIRHVQYNISENIGIDADKVSLLLPEAKDVSNDLEYFQQSETFQEDPIDKEFLIRKKNALRDSLRRKLDVLREAKLSVEAEIQELDIMKKNICSQFDNLCPNVNECRKLTDFFKDREMCQILLSKLKVRITRLENEMKETTPSHDLHDKLSKLQTQYSEAEQLSSDIDARQNSLVRLMEKYLTETNLSDFNYLLVMKPRLVAEIFELNEKIYSGGQKLLELERVPYK